MNKLVASAAALLLGVCAVLPARVQAEESAVKPLRFVLMISMRNLPGDAHNSMCYSNIITRQGPPGWGAPGFLPTGSGEQARQTVESLKADFIAKCSAASGREITSEGNFSFVWNRSQDDEANVDKAAARFREDVTVQLN